MDEPLFLYHNKAVNWYVVMRCIGRLAFIPINMYNGHRGFIRGQLAKYLVYVYYPLHLLVIYLAAT